MFSRFIFITKIIGPKTDEYQDKIFESNIRRYPLLNPNTLLHLGVPMGMKCVQKKKKKEEEEEKKQSKVVI